MMMYDREFMKLVGDIKECFRSNQMGRVSEVISAFDKDRYSETDVKEIDEIRPASDDDFERI